jgi:hypothetical protein
MPSNSELIGNWTSTGYRHKDYGDRCGSTDISLHTPEAQDGFAYRDIISIQFQEKDRLTPGERNNHRQLSMHQAFWLRAKLLEMLESIERIPSDEELKLEQAARQLNIIQSTVNAERDNHAFPRSS